MPRPPDLNRMRNPVTEAPTPAASTAAADDRLATARTRAASMFAALPAEIHELGRRFEAAGHEQIGRAHV